MGFLNQHEIDSMIGDFETLIGSPEAQVVTLRWQSGNTGVFDNQYKRYIGGVPVYATKTLVKCIVAFMREVDIETMPSNELDVKVGDAVFYFSHEYTDLSNKEDLRITHKNIEWYPYVPQPAVSELAGVPLGVDQMAQVLVCSRIKKTEPTDASGGGIVI